MDDDRWQKCDTAFSSCSSSLPSSPTSPVVYEQETVHLQLPALLKSRKRLSKQLSMQETPRDIMWEKRQRWMLRQGHQVKNGAHEPDPDVINDEDLNELRGCIELGFRFKEGEEGHRLCSTLPALDLYFAVNRQLSPCPVSPPQSQRSSSSPSLVGNSSSLESPRSDSDSWKIVSPASQDKAEALGTSSCLFCEAIFLKKIRTKKKRFLQSCKKRGQSQESDGKKIQLGRPV